MVKTDDAPSGAEKKVVIDPMTSDVEFESQPSTTNDVRIKQECDDSLSDASTKSEEEFNSFSEAHTNEASTQCELSVESAEHERMMAYARPAYDLPILHLDRDDLEDQFTKFKYIFRKLMVALNIKPEEKAKTAAHFISELPAEAKLIVAEYDWTGKDRSDEDIEDIIKAILETKAKGTSQIMARHRLWKRTMHPGVKFEDYYRALKTLADRCGYGEQKSSILRDSIIKGHTNTRLMIDVLNMGDSMTLEKVVDLCRWLIEDVRWPTPGHVRQHETTQERTPEAAGQGQQASGQESEGTTLPILRRCPRLGLR